MNGHACRSPTSTTNSPTRSLGSGTLYRLPSPTRPVDHTERQLGTPWFAGPLPPSCATRHVARTGLVSRERDDRVEWPIAIAPRTPSGSYLRPAVSDSGTGNSAGGESVTQRYSSDARRPSAATYSKIAPDRSSSTASA